MIRENYYNIENGLEVKENLLVIKDSLKDKNKGSREKEALIFAIKDNPEIFIGLLENEDPKIRKNSAVILGILGYQQSAEALFKAYTTDTIKYNKATYVEALRALDYSEYRDALKKRYDELKSTPIKEEDKKHVLDEMKQLKLIFGNGKTEFTGFSLKNECILTTNRNFRELTADALKDNSTSKLFTAGVTVKTNDLKKILPVRTYEELLFIPDGVKFVENDPAKAAKQLIDGNITDYIFARVGYVKEDNNDTVPSEIRFRVDVRAPKEIKESDFSKKLSGELEILSGFRLVNSVSDYDVEIRLVLNSAGRFNVLIRFALLKDVRFTYRKETIAATLKPYLAATLLELAYPYFKKNAAVLDPFCGVGTLIAEREIAYGARLYYGTDIFGEAIKKAETNLKLAGISKKTNLITKDFFEFEHEYKFNEVITDMPFVTAAKTEKDIENIYKKFFGKIGDFLEKNAVLVIYSRNPEFVNRYASCNGFNLRENYEISKFENSHLFILEN